VAAARTAIETLLRRRIVWFMLVLLSESGKRTANFVWGNITLGSYHMPIPPADCAGC